MDFARISLFSSSIKYSFTITQLPLSLSEKLMDTDLRWNVYDPLYPFPDTQRYFYTHRMDITLFNKLNISLIDGIMVGNNPIELRYLNPLIIFHSLFPWNDYRDWIPAAEAGRRIGSMVGAFFSVEVNYNIIDNLAIYGQFVLNDFATASELAEDYVQTPDALGFLAGINFSHTLNNWGFLYYLEFIYTYPFLYIMSSPYSSFIQMTREQQQYYYIAYPRDTISLALGANIFNRDLLKLSGRISWIAKGQHNDRESNNGLKWNWYDLQPAREEITPTGIVENKFILSLGVMWKPFPFLSLNANVAGILSFNNRHIEGNTDAGAQATLSVSFRY
jgi:hypothetical protein